MKKIQATNAIKKLNHPNNSSSWKTTKIWRILTKQSVDRTIPSTHIMPNSWLTQNIVLSWKSLGCLASGSHSNTCRFTFGNAIRLCNMDAQQAWLHNTGSEMSTDINNNTTTTQRKTNNNCLIDVFSQDNPNELEPEGFI